ncbi:MAG: M81 family metallopeptidase [Geminicoccaceae bacterium]
MHRILMLQCEQEISSFNPVPTEYEAFDIALGGAMIDANREADTCVRGALDVFGARSDVTVVPVYGAKAPSGGLLRADAFRRIAGELLEALREHASGADGLYFSLHGAMGAEGELDPEGHLLEAVRGILGPDVPIVTSLDLHGILTARMLRNMTATAVYHTYPHEDFIDTGARAARLLLRIIDTGARPVMARVNVPALVRGPELFTKSGCYGEIIRDAKRLEANGALAAAMLIGNPFTDVPELCSQSLVITDGDPESAKRGALAMAADFWRQHERMRATLVSLYDAIEAAKLATAPVTFTDAADAPSSGASGDSNAILEGLLERGYPGRVLMPIVDAPAVERAHAAGVGASLQFAIGGSLDPARFPPLPVEGRVAMLGDGRWRHEVNGLPAEAGRTAVLEADNITLIAMSRPVHLMDRSVFLAHGRDPRDFDLVVIKSPGAYSRFFTYAGENFVVDVPGATTANLPLLGHRICARPMFPLDPGVVFEPEVEVYPA